MHTFISLFHVSCHDIYIETEKASNEYPWIQKMLLLEPGFSFPCGFHYLRVQKKLRLSGNQALTGSRESRDPGIFSRSKSRDF